MTKSIRWFFLKKGGSRLHKMEKHGKDHIDMIPVTDDDPKIMHALGNVVDPGPRNYCNSIRCNYITQGLSSKRRFELSYIYIPFVVQEQLVESKSFVGNIIRNHGLPRRETPRKDGPNSPKQFFRSRVQTSMLTGTTGFH